MKKILILVLGLSLTAASCNLLGGGSGSKGILKSEDGGETYKTVNKLEKKGEISGLTANAVSLDPLDPQVIFMGSSSGMHKSVDGGNTWKPVLQNLRVGDIEVDPSSSEIVYVGGISGENGKILKSQDAGSSWEDIYTEPTKNNPVLSLAISKASSKVLLAGLNSGEILRSVDEGRTWQIVKDLSNPVMKISYTNTTTAYALTKNSGLYVSTDQGSNWAPVVVNPVPVQGSGTSTVQRLPSSRVFYDVAFDSKLTGVIFLATEQGLLRTIDGGANWSIMSLPLTNQSVTVTSVAINPTNSNNILISVGSTIFKTSNGGVTWETKKLPTQQPVQHIIINPQEPNIIYLGMGTR